MTRYRFTTPNVAQALVGLGLDADRIVVDSQQSGDPPPHGAYERRQPWRFEDHVHVEVPYGPPVLADRTDGPFNERCTVYALVFWLIIGEHASDVAQGGGAQNRIDDRMQYGISI